MAASVKALAHRGHGEVSRAARPNSLLLRPKCIFAAAFAPLQHLLILRGLKALLFLLLGFVLGSFRFVLGSFFRAFTDSK